jgi:hypothetical protein
MPKRNATDSGSGARDPRSAPADRPLWVVPRRWLVVVAALILVPWLIAAAFYSRGSNRTADNAASAAAADAGARVVGDPRPWGQLVATPIVISPPLEYVPSNWGPIEPPRWHFGRATRADLERFLSETGLPPAQVGQILASAREEAGGVVATPDPRIVRELAPDVRAEIYTQLAKSERNDRQRNAYRYLASSSEAWLGNSPISAHTRQLVEPYIYRVGDFVYFADIDLVRPLISDPAELQRLAKRLLRESTMLVRLKLDDSSQVDAAVEYWGRGGRRTDIRPLLESIVASGQDRTIDISHLLPGLAREYLYRYPRVMLADLDKPSLVNCFWTALNFFNAVPDDRYLDPKVAVDRLKRDYFIVHDQYQLGDIAAFVDPAGAIFHAAVYLADGLVFGKNGTSHLSPWTIVPIDRLKWYYVEHADHWQVVFYRRKDF